MDFDTDDILRYGLDILLKELDLQYRELVAIHKNPDIINSDAARYKQVMMLFMQAQENIFKLKSLVRAIAEAEAE